MIVPQSLLTAKEKTAPARLRQIGIEFSARDPKRNPDFPGAWMVAQLIEDDEEPANNSAWCIVGDDPNALIEEAVEVWAPELEDLATVAA